MNSQLSVDTELLVNLGGDLRSVAEEFNDAKTNADEIATAIADPSASGKMRDFADQWDDRRKKMLENIASLSDATLAVGEGFEDLDSELGASMRGEK